MQFLLQAPNHFNYDRVRFLMHAFEFLFNCPAQILIQEFNRQVTPNNRVSFSCLNKSNGHAFFALLTKSFITTIFSFFTCRRRGRKDTALS